MPQLDPTWFASQLFWLAITFIGLYLVLARMVLPPLQDVIARRRQTVEGDIEQAQRLKTQAEKARRDYERMMLDARQKAQALTADAVREGKERAESAMRNLDREIEKKLKDAGQKIHARKEALLDGLSASTAELTSMIVQKLTQARPDGQQVQAALGRLTGSGEKE